MISHSRETVFNQLVLIRGFKHEFYFPFHIWDNPSHWRNHIFQDAYCTTNQYSYGHLPVITGYFYVIIHSINGVFLVLITNKWPKL